MSTLADLARLVTQLDGKLKALEQRVMGVERAGGGARGNDMGGPDAGAMDRKLRSAEQRLASLERVVADARAEEARSGGMEAVDKKLKAVEQRLEKKLAELDDRKLDHTAAAQERKGVMDQLQRQSRAFDAQEEHAQRLATAEARIKTLFLRAPQAGRGASGEASS